MARLRSRPRGDRGVSILETAVSMFGLAFVAAIMLSWFVGANRVDELHRNDDQVVQELRVSRELLTKDVRRSRAITVAQPWELTLWLDGDHDDIVDVGERVTWEVAGNGDLVRYADDETGLAHATGLVIGSSGFTYDDVVATSIRTVTFTFVAQVDGGGKRSLSADISLRNS
jgi:hypothetical protein